MSMHLVKGITTTRSRRQQPVTKAKLAMWQQQWREHVAVFRQRRLKPPTFEEFVRSVHGDVAVRGLPVDNLPDPVLQHSKKHREQYQSQGEAYVPAKPSVMDPRCLESEPSSVKNAILDKSRRIAPAYNKGPANYVTDGSDPTELGKKL
jgi:hypothetical protein